MHNPNPPVSEREPWPWLHQASHGLPGLLELPPLPLRAPLPAPQQAEGARPAPAPWQGDGGEEPGGRQAARWTQATGGAGAGWG